MGKKFFKEGGNKMRFVDLIEKKKEGKMLSKEEIHFWIDGYVAGDIPDYQVSALLMAICFKGMEIDEIAWLTDAMLHSGEIIDLSGIDGIKVDKHSTGGVGDKTSLALTPMVAACGAKVAKMSGRGLGHTGGTLDKLEAIDGFQILMEEQAFMDQVNEIGLAIIGQTTQVVPADKKLYALRDVTGTVNAIPLIASSIMSKKLASGADTILLDVKYGEGAFMEDVQSARKLANTMIEIGKKLGKDTRALISNMNQPLGDAIGNALEVKEAIDTLHGVGPTDFTELCLEAGSVMLMQANIATDKESAIEMLKRVIEDGSAFEKLVAMVKAQGGDINQIYDPNKLPKAKYEVSLTSEEEGYICNMNALSLGLSAMKLGAGRAVKEDTIDPAVGIVLHKKVGDYVNKGDALATIYYNHELSSDFLSSCLMAFHFQKAACEKQSLVEEILQ